MTHRKTNSIVQTEKPLNSAEFIHQQLFPDRPRIFEIVPAPPHSKQLHFDLKLLKWGQTRIFLVLYKLVQRTTGERGQQSFSLFRRFQKITSFIRSIYQLIESGLNAISFYLLMTGSARKCSKCSPFFSLLREKLHLSGIYYLSDNVMSQLKVDCIDRKLRVVF